MEIIINYLVHSAVTEDVPMKVILNGRELNAMVPGLTVELVGIGEHRSMGHTFKFIPSSEDTMDEHKEIFAVGSPVKVTFEKG